MVCLENIELFSTERLQFLKLVQDAHIYIYIAKTDQLYLIYYHLYIQSFFSKKF